MRYYQEPVKIIKMVSYLTDLELVNNLMPGGGKAKISICICLTILSFLTGFRLIITFLIGLGSIWHTDRLCMHADRDRPVEVKTELGDVRASRRGRICRFIIYMEQIKIRTYSVLLIVN